jgi:transcriptional regulator with XRE-family HTH domain
MTDVVGDQQAISWVVANRLRAQRVERDFTLGQLAELSQISKGMLSKIENAQASPSLATLGRLAAALDVPITSFFRGLDEEREAVFVRADQGAEIVRQGTRVGHRYELLGNLRGVRKYVEPVLCTLTERSEVFPLFQHPGFELLYMLEGRLEYGYGTQRYLLQRGDTLQFEGEVSHGPTKLVKLVTSRKHRCIKGNFQVPAP